jgi:HSP20 family protein
VSGRKPGALQLPGCSCRLNRRSFDMAFLYSDPFETLFQFQNTLDQLRSSNWLQASPSGGGGYPPINVFRKGEDIVLVIEVPGVRKSDLRIEAKGNTIRIAGTKTVEQADKASVHRVERRGGQFDRAVTLPIEIDADRIKAECRDGILALHLPRAERDKPRAISIA